MIKTATTRYGTNPAVMNVYFMVGFFTSAWLGIAEEETYVFSPWGFAAGALLWAGAALTLAITFPVLGIALATAITAGVSIITSFVWAVCFFDESTRSIGLSILGIAIVFVGLFLTTLAGSLVKAATAATSVIVEASGESGETARLVPPANDNDNDNDNDDDNDDGGGDGTKKKGSGVRTSIEILAMQLLERYGFGVLAAFMAGVVGGSVLVPSHYGHGGISFVTSMGIGVITFTPAGFLLQLWCQGDFKPLTPWPELHFAESLPWGFGAGCIYGGATILQISAIDSLDYATAYTITQANLVITGLLGIWLFNELQGNAIWVFFVGAVLVVSGAGIVSYFGTTKR